MAHRRSEAEKKLRRERARKWRRDHKNDPVAKAKKSKYMRKYHALRRQNSAAELEAIREAKKIKKAQLKRKRLIARGLDPILAQLNAEKAGVEVLEHRGSTACVITPSLQRLYEKHPDRLNIQNMIFNVGEVGPLTVEERRLLMKITQSTLYHSIEFEQKGTALKT